MALHGNYGGEVDVLYCRAATVDVVVRSEDKRQVMSDEGIEQVFTAASIRHAPEKCPLYISPRDRMLADFAICMTCPHANIDTDDGMMEI